MRNSLSQVEKVDSGSQDTAADELIPPNHKPPGSRPSNQPGLEDDQEIPLADKRDPNRSKSSLSQNCLDSPRAASPWLLPSTRSSSSQAPVANLPPLASLSQPPRNTNMVKHKHRDGLYGMLKQATGGSSPAPRRHSPDQFESQVPQASASRKKRKESKNPKNDPFTLMDEDEQAHDGEVEIRGTPASSHKRTERRHNVNSSYEEIIQETQRQDTPWKSRRISRKKKKDIDDAVSSDRPSSSASSIPAEVSGRILDRPSTPESARVKNAVSIRKDNPAQTNSSHQFGLRSSKKPSRRRRRRHPIENTVSATNSPAQTVQPSTQMSLDDKARQVLVVSSRRADDDHVKNTPQAGHDHDSSSLQDSHGREKRDQCIPESPLNMKTAKRTPVGGTQSGVVTEGSSVTHKMSGIGHAHTSHTTKDGSVDDDSHTNIKAGYTPQDEDDESWSPVSQPMFSTLDVPDHNDSEIGYAVEETVGDEAGSSGSREDSNSTNLRSPPRFFDGEFSFNHEGEASNEQFNGIDQENGEVNHEDKDFVTHEMKNRQAHLDASKSASEIHDLASTPQETRILQAGDHVTMSSPQLRPLGDASGIDELPESPAHKRKMKKQQRKKRLTAAADVSTETGEKENVGMDDAIPRSQPDAVSGVLSQDLSLCEAKTPSQEKKKRRKKESKISWRENLAAAKADQHSHHGSPKPLPSLSGEIEGELEANQSPATKKNKKKKQKREMQKKLDIFNNENRNRIEMKDFMLESSHPTEAETKERKGSPKRKTDKGKRELRDVESSGLGKPDMDVSMANTEASLPDDEVSRDYPEEAPSQLSKPNGDTSDVVRGAESSPEDGELPNVTQLDDVMMDFEPDVEDNTLVTVPDHSEQENGVPIAQPERDDQNTPPRRSKRLQKPEQPLGDRPSAAASLPQPTTKSRVGKPIAQVNKTRKSKSGLVGNCKTISLEVERIKVQPLPGNTFLQGVLSEEEKQAFAQTIKSFQIQKGLTQYEVNEMVKDHPHKTGSHVQLWNALILAVPHRKTAKLRDYARKNFHNYVARGRWTPEQDEELIDLHNKFGDSWVSIGAQINRHPEDVRDRWRNHLSWGKQMRSGKWTAQEENELIHLVRKAVVRISKDRQKHPNKYPTGENSDQLVDFKMIGQSMSTKRSRLQCLYKWNHVKGITVGVQRKSGVAEESDEQDLKNPSLAEKGAKYHEMTAADKLEIVRGVQSLEVGKDDLIRWEKAVGPQIRHRFHPKALELAWLRMKARVPGHERLSLGAICDKLIKMYENAGDEAEQRESGLDERFDAQAIISPSSRKPGFISRKEKRKKRKLDRSGDDGLTHKRKKQADATDVSAEFVA